MDAQNCWKNDKFIKAIIFFSLNKREWTKGLRLGINQVDHLCYNFSRYTHVPSDITPRNTSFPHHKSQVREVQS